MIIKTTQLKTILNSQLWILILTLFIGLLVNVFYNNTILSASNEGDIGRDLYNFYLVSKGQLPYIDFNWIYGPFVPLIQGLNFKLFGASYHNALNFVYVIIIISTYLTYFIVNSFTNKFFSFLASFLFICSYSFYFHTFNHVAGLPFILLMLFFLLKFLKEENTLYIYLIALCTVFLAIIKLNMSIAYSVPIYIILYIYYFKSNKPIKHIIISNISIVLATIAIYGSFIAFAPLDQFNKWFPYNVSYIQSSQLTFWEKFSAFDLTNISDIYNFANSQLLIHYITSHGLWFFIIPIPLFIIALYKLASDKKSIKIEYIYILTLATIVLLSSHEFLKAGTLYSLRLWAVPVLVILLFYTIEFFIHTCSDKKYFKPVLTLSIISIVVFSGAKFYLLTQYSNNQFHYCPYERMKISLGNFSWYVCMAAIKEYTDKNTDPSEYILSIPYNSIYNFITKRDQPSRITEFNYLSQLTEKDQKNIIAGLEKKKVKYIFHTLKQGKTQGGMGIFGKTHCKILNQYIKQNYEIDIIYTFKYNTIFPTASISILKRKTPFKG